MAKRFEFEQFGLKVIARHDYENKEISDKINSYRARSVKELTEFLTNVPGSDKFTSFLDVGCGDNVDMKLFKDLNPNFTKVVGIDKYLDEDDYKGTNIISGDWYNMDILGYFNVIYMNHSLEHAANVYAVMEQISSMQEKGDVLFIAVPEGNSEFGYAITSSTTHFSILNKGFLSTTMQRFGYNTQAEDREFRKGSPELFAFGIKN